MKQFKNISDLQIRLIALDVDGVLTDGTLGYDSTGNEIKFFHARDGHWLKIAQRAGWKVGIISGREAQANRRRAAELNFDFLEERCHDKLATFEEVCTRYAVAPEQCMYMGDDVVDMPVLRRAGLAVVPNDALSLLDEVADLRTDLPGGHGAVAEAVIWLLEKMNLLDGLMERYRK
ncbi:MAG: HAD-IIIA family hydrolase [Victivallaceae bacterium]|nr:HAD-IIIA family hydrolase [Victivallaceae bacterium]